MMILYEVTCGWTGESYVRCYAWAKDEWEARLLVKQVNGNYKEWQDDSRWTVKELMTSESVPFCTESSDEGWVEEHKR